MSEYDVRVHPTRDDPVVRGLSESLGGPVGDHAGPHRWWTPVRVVLALTAVCFALGLVQKTSCYTSEWMNSDTRYSHMCYSDLPYLYNGRGLAELNWPYTADPQVRARFPVMEYPAGISYYAIGTAWVTHWLSGSPDVSQRFDQPVGRFLDVPSHRREMLLYVVVNAVGLAACALGAAWFLAGVHRRRPWDAALFAASPALALTAIVNWDLLAVVAVAGALWAWARDRPLLTGVLIGVGAATKLYPLFLLGGLLVICARQRRWGDLARASVAAALAWLVVNAPALLTGPDQWKVFWTFNKERGPDLGSLWVVVAQAGHTTIGAGTVNTWSWALFAAWCVGVLAVGLIAPRPRLAQLGFLIVAGFLLVNKVYSPQYVLWLLPLAALARPRWRDLLIWQAGEVLYFAGVWWYLGGELNPAGGSDVGFYWVAVMIRVAAELYLVAVVVRDLLRPWHDPVDEPEWLDTPDPAPVTPRPAARALV